MKMVIEKVKMKNLYTGDIVICENPDHVEKDGDISFVKVYEEHKPDRKYWVNKESFKILKG
jgi:hypothetical protein